MREIRMESDWLSTSTTARFTGPTPIASYGLGLSGPTRPREWQAPVVCFS
jgi:hypothetical protein